ICPTALCKPFFRGPPRNASLLISSQAGRTQQSARKYGRCGMQSWPTSEKAFQRVWDSVWPAVECNREMSPTPCGKLIAICCPTQHPPHCLVEGPQMKVKDER